ncbi:hypothetical protein [Rhizobium halophytocola]|uniref:Uncharacterized protein n=1 Tax=Rhizobium halophytocola TaxID=735519 RepID=A0ABS4E0P9_9HYPH|nr:hypothetical protein [Rhizobium halophytocola]MBP1851515.1 hypothetical protein [Rhizobium halophytocola]
MQTAIEELEGRLNAQREIMVSLFAALLRDGKIDDIDQLAEEISPHNGEEDPGLEPSRAFAVEGATAREMRSIVEAAKARAQAFSRG